MINLDGVRWLYESLERDRGVAHDVARYQTAQRDEFTSKIRFGVVALNGASVVSLLGIVGNSALLVRLGFNTQIVAAAVASFVAGTAAAGASLYFHQNHLVKLAGAAIARARTLDTAVGASQADPNGEVYAGLPALMNKAAELENEGITFSTFAIVLQNCGTGLWLGGVLSLLWGLWRPGLQEMLPAFLK